MQSDPEFIVHYSHNVPTVIQDVVFGQEDIAKKVEEINKLREVSKSITYVAKGESQQIVVSVGILGRSSEVVDQLRSDQWQNIHSVLGVIYAQKNTKNYKIKERLLSAIISYFKETIEYRSSYPSAYIHATVGDRLVEGAIKVKGKLITVEWQYDNRGLVRKVREYSRDSDLLLILPSKAISQINKMVGGAIDNAIKENIGLDKVRVDVVESLAVIKNMTIESSRDSLAMHVYPVTEGAWDQTITAWANEQESRNTPEKKAFALPDGSIAYELAPGKVNLSEDIVNNCKKIYGKFVNIWQCVDNNSLTIASTMPSEAIPEAQEGDWYVSVSQQVLGQINGLQSIDSLVASGSSSGGVLLIRGK